MDARIPLAVIALTAGPVSPGPIPPAAQAALTRLVGRYAAGVAHAASFIQTYTPAGFAGSRKEAGTVWIQAPQRLRFEYADPDPKVFTYDAGEGRFYSPQDRQLTIKKLSAQERARLPIAFLSDPAELSREFAISAEPGGDVADGLRLLPRAARPDLAWLRLTIAPDGALRELSYEDEGGNKTEFRFESWRAEKARGDSDFRVTGPKGTRVVEN